MRVLVNLLLKQCLRIRFFDDILCFQCNNDREASFRFGARSPSYEHEVTRLCLIALSAQRQYTSSMSCLRAREIVSERKTKIECQEQTNLVSFCDCSKSSMDESIVIYLLERWSSANEVDNVSWSIVQLGK